MQKLEPKPKPDCIRCGYNPNRDISRPMHYYKCCGAKGAPCTRNREKESNK